MCCKVHSGYINSLANPHTSHGGNRRPVHLSKRRMSGPFLLLMLDSVTRGSVTYISASFKNITYLRQDAQVRLSTQSLSLSFSFQLPSSCPFPPYDFPQFAMSLMLCLAEYCINSFSTITSSLSAYAGVNEPFIQCCLQQTTTISSKLDFRSASRRRKENTTQSFSLGPGGGFKQAGLA